MPVPQPCEIFRIYERHILELTFYVFGGACRCGAQRFGGNAAVAHGGERGVERLREPGGTGGSGVMTQFVAVFLYDLGEHHDRALRSEAFFYARAHHLFREPRERSHAHVEHRVQPQRGDDAAFGGSGEFVGHYDHVLSAVRELAFELLQHAVVRVMRGI